MAGIPIQPGITACVITLSQVALPLSSLSSSSLHFLPFQQLNIGDALAGGFSALGAHSRRPFPCGFSGYECVSLFGRSRVPEADLLGGGKGTWAEARVVALATIATLNVTSKVGIAYGEG